MVSANTLANKINGANLWQQRIKNIDNQNFSIFLKILKSNIFQLLSLSAVYTRCERLVAAGTLTECSVKGDKRVCDGAVTKTLKSSTPSVQVCDMGKLKVKNVKQVGAGAPSPGGGRYDMFKSFDNTISRV